MSEDQRREDEQFLSVLGDWKNDDNEEARSVFGCQWIKLRIYFKGPILDLVWFYKNKNGCRKY